VKTIHTYVCRAQQEGTQRHYEAGWWEQEEFNTLAEVLCQDLRDLPVITPPRYISVLQDEILRQDHAGPAGCENQNCGKKQHEVGELAPSRYLMRSALVWFDGALSLCVLSKKVRTLMADRLRCFHPSFNRATRFGSAAKTNSKVSVIVFFDHSGRP